jgi:hypothetical protein
MSDGVDIGGRIGNCWSCGASIVWVRTEAGKAMPVDYLPVVNGNLVAAGKDRVRYVSKDRPAPEGVPRYFSHFATCADLKDWRRL